MSRERDVEEVLRKHLKEHGYAVRERTSKHGVDITAFRDGRNYYVEIEGNTKRSGTPFNRSQLYTHLLRAVGQICLRMNDDPNGIYEIVLAEDEYYRDLVNRLQTALRKLGVITYFVNPNGRITK